MAISEATIREMQQILKEDYGKDLTLGEVAEITKNLVGYFDLLARIHYREKNKNDYDEKNRFLSTV